MPPEWALCLRGATSACSQMGAILAKPAGICSLLVVAGTAIAQFITNGRADPRALCRSAIYGLAKGCINFVWMDFANGWYPGNDFASVGSKVLLDQILFTPIGGYLPFFLIMAALEGRGLASGLSDARAKTVRLLLLGWRIWPFVNFACFTFVPARHQMYVVWTVGVVWNAIMALVTAHRAPPKRGGASDSKSE